MFQQRCQRRPCCIQHFHPEQWWIHWRGCCRSLEIVSTSSEAYRAGVTLTALVGKLKASKGVAQALAHTLACLNSH